MLITSTLLLRLVEQTAAAAAASPGRFSNSGTCFSRSARGDFGISTRGGSMRTGSCTSSFFLLSSTTSSRRDRRLLARAPVLRAPASLREQEDVRRFGPCPQPLDHRQPGDPGEKAQARGEHERAGSACAPVNPRACAMASARPRSPRIPPGACGSVAFRRVEPHCLDARARGRARARSRCPRRCTTGGRLRRRSSMRRKPHATRKPHNTTHQYAERPKR